MHLAMQTGIPVREWAPGMASDHGRVLDTALAILAEAARKAERGRRRGG